MQKFNKNKIFIFTKYERNKHGLKYLWKKTINQ